MLLKLERGESGIGNLSIDSKQFCHTLEGDKPIPPGTYQVIMTRSPKFNNQYLPLLASVPGRAAIRIHAGNFSSDTEGCILIGFGVGDMNGDKKVDLKNSRAALDALLPQLTDSLLRGDLVRIEILPPTLSPPTLLA